MPAIRRPSAGETEHSLHLALLVLGFRFADGFHFPAQPPNEIQQRAKPANSPLKPEHQVVAKFGIRLLVCSVPLNDVTGTSRAASSLNRRLLSSFVGKPSAAVVAVGFIVQRIHEIPIRILLARPILVSRMIPNLRALALQT